jgi:hypothetical protein
MKTASTHKMIIRRTWCGRFMYSGCEGLGMGM